MSRDQVTRSARLLAVAEKIHALSTGEGVTTAMLSERCGVAFGSVGPILSKASWTSRRDGRQHVWSPPAPSSCDAAGEP